jgi:hypothetical protein
MVAVEIIVAIEELGQVLGIRIAYLLPNSIEATQRDSRVAEHGEERQVGPPKIRHLGAAWHGPKLRQREAHLWRRHARVSVSLEH